MEHRGYILTSEVDAVQSVWRVGIQPGECNDRNIILDRCRFDGGEVCRRCGRRRKET